MVSSTQMDPPPSGLNADAWSFQSVPFLIYTFFSSLCSPHVLTGLAGLGLLSLQGILPALFASQGKSARDVVSDICE